MKSKKSVEQESVSVRKTFDELFEWSSQGGPSHSNKVVGAKVNGEKDNKAEKTSKNICWCCGRHMSELKPFSDQQVKGMENLKGALLVRRSRPDWPYDLKAEKAFEKAQKCYKAEGFKNPWDRMTAKYGEEKTKDLSFGHQLNGCRGKSFECSECAFLSDDEYWDVYWDGAWYILEAPYTNSEHSEQN